MEATAVKEKPILFTGEMVRAILSGAKTQTRRPVKPQPSSPCVMASESTWMGGKPTCIWPADYVLDDGTRPDCFAVCPFGKVGERLWVRETWQVVPKAPHRDWPGLEDDRPQKVSEWNRLHRVVWRADGEFKADEIWRPSIHMPRWASRIDLEITDVRVEPLQSISEEDARAEGIERVNQLGILRTCGWKDYSEASPGFMRSAESFRTLWDSINAKSHPWASNPWVWVVEFKRI